MARQHVELKISYDVPALLQQLTDVLLKNEVACLFDTLGFEPYVQKYHVDQLLMMSKKSDYLMLVSTILLNGLQSRVQFSFSELFQNMFALLKPETFLFQYKKEFVQILESILVSAEVKSATKILFFKKIS